MIHMFLQNKITFHFKRSIKILQDEEDFQIERFNIIIWVNKKESLIDSHMIYLIIFIIKNTKVYQ